MDGRLILANDRQTTPKKKTAINPATLESVGEFYLASSEDCRKAIQTAKEAFKEWREYSAKDRKKIFIQARKILLSRREEAAKLITIEKGSPYVESLTTEVLGGLEALDYYAYESQKNLKEKKAEHNVVLFLNKKSYYHYHPLGPTLVITPWNYPFLIPMYDVLGALSSGNTVILRPSSSTALIGLLVGEILTEAGLPPGVLSVLPCRVTQAEEMITHPDIQTVMFTGSTGVGKKIMELASRNLTNITLELGGKDPMIVCQDADMERAAAGAVWGAFTNCGQSCGSVERLYVEKAIEAEFTEKVLEKVKELRVGDPSLDHIDIGPMVTEEQLETVKSHIHDAQTKGAQILHGGGNTSSLPGYFLQPTLLNHVDHTMTIMTEETFGPVLPIMGFSTPEEALFLANDSKYGLTASVWTRSKKTAAWMADRIEAGTVTINDHMYSFAEPGAIWGGIKQTGIGRSHGRFGQLHLVNIKYISQDFSKKKSQLWWYPYGPSLIRILDKAFDLFHHAKTKTKVKSLIGLLPVFAQIIKKSPLLNYIRGFPRLFRK
jgi:succinate-semialdehyde dehydrogenase/glutarate-semialdehyde dehydrogenase